MSCDIRDACKFQKSVLGELGRGYSTILRFLLGSKTFHGQLIYSSSHSEVCPAKSSWNLDVSVPAIGRSLYSDSVYSSVGITNGKL